MYSLHALTVGNTAPDNFITELQVIILMKLLSIEECKDRVANIKAPHTQPVIKPTIYCKKGTFV